MIGENNPLNIRYNPLNKWAGMKDPNRGFCQFVHVNYCIRACAILLMRSYRKKGLKTVSELIRRYAPYSENPTDNYVLHVCRVMSVFPWDIPSTPNDFAKMIYAMWSFEQGKAPTMDKDFILSVIDHFKIKVYEAK